MSDVVRCAEIFNPTEEIGPDHLAGIERWFQRVRKLLTGPAVTSSLGFERQMVDVGVKRAVTFYLTGSPQRGISELMIASNDGVRWGITDDQKVAFLAALALYAPSLARELAT